MGSQHSYRLVNFPKRRSNETIQNIQSQPSPPSKVSSIYTISAPAASGANKSPFVRISHARAPASQVIPCVSFPIPTGFIQIPSDDQRYYAPAHWLFVKKSEK